MSSGGEQCRGRSALSGQADRFWIDALAEAYLGEPPDRPRRDPFIVQRNLRYASFSTTEGDIHKDRDQQHQETEKHTLTDTSS
jgi:hypothetical protein